MSDHSEWQRMAARSTTDNQNFENELSLMITIEYCTV